jgi:hypothetical protein
VEREAKEQREEKQRTLRESRVPDTSTVKILWADIDTIK